MGWPLCRAHPGSEGIPLIYTPTGLDGAWLLEPERVDDERGFFMRTWCRHEFEEHGLETQLAQCNVSWNRRRGTLRGMHYQGEPHAEAKLVRCTRGALHDVIIDVRPGSPTRGRHYGVDLTAANYRMLYIPEGLAHGFITLEDDTEIFYLMSEFYTASAARGVRWDDPTWGIRWPIEVAVISERDRNLPLVDPAEFGRS